MKISLSTFLYVHYSLRDAIDRIADFGYDGVEIWGGRPHAYRRDLTSTAMRDLRARIAERGLTVSAFIPAQFRYPTNLCTDDDVIREDSIAYITDSIKTAAALGAPIVTVCPGHSRHGQSKEDAWGRLVESLTTLARRADDLGLRLAVESADRYETDLVQTVDETLSLLEDVGMPGVGALYDTGHGHAFGVPLAVAIERLGTKLFHAHIEDNHGTSDEHLIPGDGTLPLSECVAALQQSGYDGFLTAELGWSYTIDPDPAASLTCQRLSALTNQ